MVGSHELPELSHHSSADTIYAVAEMVEDLFNELAYYHYLLNRGLYKDVPEIKTTLAFVFTKALVATFPLNLHKVNSALLPFEVKSEVYELLFSVRDLLQHHHNALPKHTHRLPKDIRSTEQLYLVVRDMFELDQKLQKVITQLQASKRD